MNTITDTNSAYRVATRLHDDKFQAVMMPLHKADNIDPQAIGKAVQDFHANNPAPDPLDFPDDPALITGVTVIDTDGDRNFFPWGEIAGIRAGRLFITCDVTESLTWEERMNGRGEGSGQFKSQHFEMQTTAIDMDAVVEVIPDTTEVDDNFYSTDFYMSTDEFFDEDGNFSAVEE